MTISLVFRKIAKVLRVNAIGISREQNNIWRERNIIARERNIIARGGEDRRNSCPFRGCVHMTFQGLRTHDLSGAP